MIKDELEKAGMESMRRTFNQLISGERKMTEDRAIQLAKLTGTKPSSWMFKTTEQRREMWSKWKKKIRRKK